jgi:hypothetical protein
VIAVHQNKSALRLQQDSSSSAVPAPERRSQGLKDVEASRILVEAIAQPQRNSINGLERRMSDRFSKERQ